MGYRDRVMMGSTRPSAVEPLAGNMGKITAKQSRSSVPIIKEGMDTKAVTMIMMAGGVLMEPEEPQYRVFHANEPFRYYIVTTQTQTPLVVFAGQEVR